MKHLLIIGSPRVGKTTLVKRLMRALNHLPIEGFVTEEQAEGDKPAGYWLSLADGRQMLLAKGQPAGGSQGSAGINVSVLDEMAVPLIANAHKKARLLFIDELSKVEPASEMVSRAVRKALDQEPVIIATAGVQSNAFINKLKQRRDVELIPLTVSNRDLIGAELLERLGFLCAVDEAHQPIEQKAKRICELIVSANAPILDIEIQQSQLRQLVENAFPDQPQRYQLLYEMRFRRLWQQFRYEAVS